MHKDTILLNARHDTENESERNYERIIELTKAAFTERFGSIIGHEAHPRQNLEPGRSKAVIGSHQNGSQDDGFQGSA